MKVVTKTTVTFKKEHSFIKHLLLCFVGVGFITIPYITLSRKHCWKM